ncbi:MAG: C39 family peptidase [Planctomycetes bacterium]|nr:C39 family peptidase [Planctomycetota bacterium]
MRPSAPRPALASGRAVALALVAAGLLSAFHAFADPARRPALDPRAFPFEHQAPDFCGEACLAMALRHWGVEADQYKVFALSGLDPGEGRGAYTREMHAAARRIWGDACPSPWMECAATPADLAKRFDELTDRVAAGTPCMICCRYSEKPDATEHFRLVTAVDRTTGEVTYQEPAEKAGAARTMTRERFLALWPVSGSQGKLLILFPFPEPPAAARALLAGTGTLAGRVAQTVRRVRARVGPGFRLGVEGPFVIASDQSARGFQTSREGTIRWAYTHLQDQFFPGGLSTPVEVYLFDGERSYNAHVKEWFGEEPHTPFGYYTHERRALIMNIATGGGTLVHEMVHPLMEEHFPGVPSWFNEGLASLFEQCGERDGKMVGLLNWRYQGLMAAIQNKQFVSLDRLMQSTTRAFYGNDQGDNYGIARYLCQYLQARGKIEAYYREFKATYGVDPTGIAALKKVLGEESLEKIQADWLAWLKTLK